MYKKNDFLRFWFLLCLNFTHAMTTELWWHVQNRYLIGFLFHIKITGILQCLGHKLANCQWNGFLIVLYLNNLSMNWNSQYFEGPFKVISNNLIQGTACFEIEKLYYRKFSFARRPHMTQCNGCMNSQNLSLKNILYMNFLLNFLQTRFAIAFSYKKVKCS